MGPDPETGASGLVQRGCIPRRWPDCPDRRDHGHHHLGSGYPDGPSGQRGHHPRMFSYRWGSTLGGRHRGPAGAPDPFGFHAHPGHPNCERARAKCGALFHHTLHGHTCEGAAGWVPGPADPGAGPLVGGKPPCQKPSRCCAGSCGTSLAYVCGPPGSHPPRSPGSARPLPGDPGFP